jgi:hypothetical protein
MTSSAAMHKIVRIKTSGRIVYLLKPCNRRGKRQCDLKSNWVTPARNAGTSFGLEASHVSPLKQPRAQRATAPRGNSVVCMPKRGPADQVPQGEAQVVFAGCGALCEVRRDWHSRWRNEQGRGRPPVRDCGQIHPRCLPMINVAAQKAPWRGDKRRNRFIRKRIEIILS